MMGDCLAALLCAPERQLRELPWRVSLLLRTKYEQAVPLCLVRHSLYSRWQKNDRIRSSSDPSDPQPPRRDSEGAYAAVIPKWMAYMTKGEFVDINGDVETSWDFCVADVEQANLLAATAGDLSPDAKTASLINQAYSIALVDRTTLNDLYAQFHRSLRPSCPHSRGMKPPHCEFGNGDVRHSLADIRKACAADQ